MRKITLAVLGVWLASSVCATEVYLDELDFMNAAPGIALEGFEDMTATNAFGWATPLQTEGFTMIHGNPNLSAATLIIADFVAWGLGPVEGKNYTVWQCSLGDWTMDIVFNEPVNAFGFTIFDALEIPGEIRLYTDSGEAETVLAGQYPNGHRAFFGLVSEETFTRVTFVGNNASYDAFGLDALYYGVVQNEVVIEAGLEMTPDRMNLKSKGRWATAHISLPEEFPVADIDPESVAITAIEGDSGLRDYLQFADLDFTPVLEDYNDDGVPDLTVKFDRRLLFGNLERGDLWIAVEGDLLTGEHFISVAPISVK